MKIAFSTLLMIMGLLVFLQSCSYDKEMLVVSSNCPDTVNISFSAKVQPILQANCFSCHANGSSAGNVSLQTYDQVKAIAGSGHLLGSISHSAGFAPMPIGGKLDDCSIQAIKTWIEEGIKNN